MSQFLDRHDRAPGDRPGVFRVLSRSLHFTLSHFWRLFMATLMASLFSIGMWGGFITPVYAATLARQASSQHQSALALTVPQAPHLPRVNQALQLPQAPVRARASASIAATLFHHEQAVGDQPYFTYMNWQVNDHLKVAVNVGSGNLVVHASDLHIKGTRVDLSIERFYNPIATTDEHSVLSQHWTLSIAPDVYLQFNSDSSITYYSPSSTPFLFTPNGSGGFTDPAGLNATLTKQSSDGAYHLDFHKNQETYEFDSSGRFIDDEDKNSKQITYNYTNGQMTSISDTQSRVTTLTYNSQGQLTTITDPSGRKVLYTYDARGNLATSTDALGQTTTYAYETGSDDLTQLTDPAGHIFKFAYNDTVYADQVASLTEATGAVTSFSYDANSDGSQTTVVTDARGNQTTYDADASMRVTKVTDALGHTQSKTYTPNSDVASTTDSLTNTTQFTFDANNNITSASDATGAKDSFSYQDSAHPFFPSGSQDAQGNSLAYTYDSPGNLTSVKNVTSGGAGETTSYSYNSDGTLHTMTDGNGHQTSYSYDSVGNQIKVTPPGPLGATTIQPDSLSRATSVTDGKGQTTSFTYDALDRITKISYADGSAISYKRDTAGNVTSLTDNTGTTLFTYDAANRLLTKTLPGGVTLSMTYDSMGDLTSFTDQAGKVSYSYNVVNLLTTLTEPGGASTTFSYDANNRRTATAYPNGVTLSLTYDKAGNETAITGKNAGGSTLAGYSYSYGGTHLRQSMTDQVLGQLNSYHYDSMNRLKEDSVTHGSSQVNDFKYSYDKAGNRSSQTTNGTTTSYNYNAANELTSTSAGVSYSYDANGNLTSISAGNEAFTYNAKNQTTSINGIPMTYSGADQKQRVQADGTSYVNAPFGISSQTSSSGTTYYTRDNRGNLVDERTPSGTFSYLFDGLGSIVGLSNSSGNLVGSERYQYDPFGNLLTNPVSTTLQSNIWRYAGGQFDSGTKLTKFGVRYYDPSAGRWTQQDPIGGSLFDPQSSNRYVYAKCDPVNVVDLSGASCIQDAITTIIALLGSAADGFLAGLGLLAVAAGEATLTAGLVFSWIAFPIVAIAAAAAAAVVIGECTGHNYSFF
jgi:RHS repeat-associated protein